MSDNMINKVFGKLTVIDIDLKRLKKDKERVKNGEIKRYRKHYICICECGNTISVGYENLKHGNTTSCGCKNKKLKDDKNIYIGQKFNKWTIIGIENNMFKCKCECGVVANVKFHNIINGLSKDCGCGRKQNLSSIKKKEIIGNKYGKLTVIEECGKTGYGKLLYKCKCECGNECIVNTSCLYNGHTKSCGCMISQYNIRLKEIVEGLGYECESEYYIDLREYGYTFMRFDLYISSLNLAIEYDGEGHYEPIGYGGDPNENFILTQKRDEIKNNYCADKNIHLLRIPYWEKENMENIIINKINELITNND